MEGNYEGALAMKLLPPNFFGDEVLCEWEILGQSDQEIFYGQYAKLHLILEQPSPACLL
jgi:hypothetical protein